MRRSISTRLCGTLSATTAPDDIAEYYIANYYDQVSSWIAERKAQA